MNNQTIGIKLVKSACSASNLICSHNTRLFIQDDEVYERIKSLIYTKPVTDNVQNVVNPTTKHIKTKEFVPKKSRLSVMNK